MQRCGNDHSQWITLHRQFHTRLCAISAAPRLLQQIAALHAVVEPLLRIWLADALDGSAEQAIHQQLLAGLQSGEPEPFEQAMRAHVRATAQRITRAMRATQSGGGVA
ncbi:FCD domain protein [compost metagenome]